MEQNLVFPGPRLLDDQTLDQYRGPEKCIADCTYVAFYPEACHPLIVRPIECA